MSSEFVSEKSVRMRARTINPKRVPFYQREEARAEAAGAEAFARPATRGECLQGEHAQRPCPFVSCKHHLYLDVSETSGSIKVNFPHLEVWEMPETCALDVADGRGKTLDEVGAVMNVARERVRQLESRGIATLRESPLLEHLRDAVFVHVEPTLDLHASNLREGGGIAKVFQEAAAKLLPIGDEKRLLPIVVRFLDEAGGSVGDVYSVAVRRETGLTNTTLGMVVRRLVGLGAAEVDGGDVYLKPDHPYVREVLATPAT